LHVAKHNIHILGAASAGLAFISGFLMAFDFLFFYCVFPTADGRADGLAEAALDFLPDGAAFADLRLFVFSVFLVSLAFFIALVFFCLFALAFIVPDFRLLSVFFLAAFEPLVFLFALAFDLI